MTSIDYNAVYQSFYMKVEAYDFLELDDDTANEFLCNWLHASVRPPYVRRIFSSLTLDDEEEVITYEMKYPLAEDPVVDEEGEIVYVDTVDEDYVTEILALGMGIQWLTPKVNSLINLRSVYASKEEKMFSPAQTLNSYKALLDSWKKEQRRMISDRGYMHNPYVNMENLHYD